MPKSSSMKWMIWSLAVAFYFYEYFLRVSPSVMVPELMRSFAVDATALGTLSAFYFYSYAPMQLPVGVLMDRFGARRLLTVATVICAAGAFGFMATNILVVAELSRLLMGFGSAFAFVGMVYISSHWFSGKKLALIVGVGNSLGMLGAVGGEGPLSFLVDNYGCQWTMVVLGFCGLLLALVIYLFVRSVPRGNSTQKRQKRCENTACIFRNLKTVLKNKSTWLNAMIALFFYAPTVAFAGLWAVPFISKTYEVSNKLAGFAASMIYVGWIVGGPIFGYFSDKMKKRKPMIFVFSLLASISLLVMIYMPGISLVGMFILSFVTGLCLSVQLLTYSMAIELNPIMSKGTSLAITNFFVFFGGALIQTLVGFLIVQHWKGQMLGGIPLYSIEDFHYALLCFPAATLLASFITLFLNEKKYSSLRKVHSLPPVEH